MQRAQTQSLSESLRKTSRPTYTNRQLPLVSLLAASLLLSCDVSGKATGANRANLEPNRSLFGKMVSSVRVEDLCESCDKRLPLVLVAEGDFLAALGPDAHSGSDFKQFGAEVAAASTNRATLGVFAAPSSGEFSGEVFIVAQDIDELDGALQSRHFYVAVVKLTVTGTLGMDPHLALAGEELSVGACEQATSRGCRPLTSEGGVEAIHLWASGDEGAGLPAEVILNAEAPEGEPNASGLTPELRLYWGGEGVTNRFACHGRIAVDSCEAGPSQADLLNGQTHAIELPYDGLALIDERDVPLLLSSSEPANEFDLSIAVHLATVSNLPETRGIVADRVEHTSVSSGVFLVARTPTLDQHGQLNTREFYVLARRANVVLPWTGINPKIVLPNSWLQIPTPRGPCGLISSTRDLGYCGPLECLPGGISSYANPRFGEEKWSSGKARTTLRVPGTERPQSRTTIYACNELQPPPPGTPVCRNQTESCNGEDDNCNGAVDEGQVCETRCTP